MQKKAITVAFIIALLLSGSTFLTLQSKSLFTASSMVSQTVSAKLISDTNSVYSLQLAHQSIVQLPNGTLCTAFSTDLLGTLNYAIYLSSSNDEGATWDAPTKISNATGMDNQYCNQGTYGTAIVSDANNNVYVAWTGVNDSSTYFQIWCTKYNGLTWSDPIRVSQGAGLGVQAFGLSMATDEDNNVNLVWQAYVNVYSFQRIFYAKYDGSWSLPIVISTEINNSVYNQMYPDIAIDPANNLHVVWTSGSDSIFGSRQVWYTEYNGGWQNPTEISSGAGLDNHFMSNPCIAVSPIGNLYVVWNGISEYGSAFNQIWFAIHTSDWSTPMRVSNSAQMDQSDQTYPTVAVDSNNIAHVAWNNAQQDAIFYSNYTSTWSTPIQLEASLSSCPQFRCSYYPSSNQVTTSLDFVFLSGHMLTFDSLSLPSASPIFGMPNACPDAIGSGTQFESTGSKFSLDSEAYVTSISCMMENSDPQNSNYAYSFAIYSDNNGAVGNLIAQTIQGISSNKNPEWNTLAFPQPVDLAPGKYWLISVADNTLVSINDAYTPGSDNATAESSIGGMVFPPTLSSTTYTFGMVTCIYTSGIFAISPTPTPSPSPTASPSPTPSPTLTPPPTNVETPTPSPTLTPCPTATLTPPPTASSTPTPTPTTIPTATPTPTPTPTPKPSLPSPILSFYCISSTTTSGFNVQIQGSLVDNTVGISGAGIQLSYSVTGGATWQDLSYLYTDNAGNFTCVWNPLASGNYVIEVTWSGNNNYSNATAIYNFAVAPFNNQNQNVFSVTSNSTLTSLTFDSTANELSFSVNGSLGSTGFTEVCIPQSLISDISKINLTLDGQAINYNSVLESNIWMITFTYHHSSHTIVMQLETAITQPTSSPTSTPILSPAVTPTSTPNPTQSPKPTSSQPPPSQTPAQSIPEFSWLIILPLFASVLFIAVKFRHRKPAILINQYPN